ncbi:MAG: fluoride efflux transporter CrcB [Solirubrobacterales bacterium]|nr:fluoride efflux transporter CrcB [Solirubrobacterales bacterium]
MTLLTWIAAGAIGGLGAVLRAVVDHEVSARMRGVLPLGILAVNLSGALAIGLLAGLEAGGDTALLAGTALLGSYTTFSTWMLQAWALDRGGRRDAAVAYLTISLVLGLGAVALGHATGAAL